MHLSIILAIDQLNAQILFLISFYIPLHVSNTVVLIIRRSNCIIQQLVSSHSVGGRPVHRTATYNLTSWWWAQQCSKHVEEYKKLIIKKFCIKLVVAKMFLTAYVQSLCHKDPGCSLTNMLCARLNTHTPKSKPLTSYDVYIRIMDSYTLRPYWTLVLFCIIGDNLDSNI